MMIKIYKNEKNKILLEYSEERGSRILNFEELLNFAKFFVEKPNFKEIKLEEITFNCSHELELYKKTLYDLIESIQKDDELLDVILDTEKLQEEINAQS